MITCNRCGREHPSNVVHDQTKCLCGNLITAYVTTADGRRISEDEALRDGDRCAQLDSSGRSSNRTGNAERGDRLDGWGH